jgi:hypothetical protein
LRAITGNDRHNDSAVMISSVKPSAKYSCSGSPEMFASGNTARAEERNIASVIESARLETPADALQRGMSERNAVNIAARLQVIANPGGIADPVRKNIAFLNDDVADMYADAEFDPPVWRHRGNKNAMKHGLAGRQ